MKTYPEDWSAEGGEERCRGGKYVVIRKGKWS